MERIWHGASLDLTHPAPQGGGRIEPAERDHRPPSTGGVRLYVGDGGESFREGARRWEPERVDWGE